MKRSNCLVLVTLLFFVYTTGFGWGDTGHMTVAQIAFDNLDSNAKRAHVNELASLVKFYDKEYEFITSACWMDDIRDAPMFEPLKDWHFVTQRYIINNAVPNELPAVVNVASIIVWLGNQIRSKEEPNLKKAYYLAELTHLVGDIHQPLHCATRFTVNEKDGDRGGNYYSLSEFAPRKNLHSYWDAAGGLFGFGDVGRPMTENRRATLYKYASAITKDVPKTALEQEIKRLNPTGWAKEGFDIVVTDVYSGIREDDIPSDTYKNKTQQISKKRIALAGYRLAAILNVVLD